MTEIASPSPTDAVPPLVPGDNAQPSEPPPSTPEPETAQSVKSDPDELLGSTNGHDHDKITPGKSTEQLSEAQTPHSNGVHTQESTRGDEDGPPAKRRRVRDTTPNNSARKPKPESPPWKKIEAEGPSTFRSEDGRRKSGRINTIPLELQPGDKRITRRVAHPTPAANRNTATNGHASTPTSANAKRTAASARQASTKQPSNKAPLRKPTTSHEPKPSTRARRRSGSPRRVATPLKQSVGTRRSTRHLRETEDDGDSEVTPAGTRINLRARPPLTTIPLVHREQANLRPKLGPTFEEFLDRATEIPVEQGGLLVAADDGPRYTQETVEEDARIILRVEKELEPGGILTETRCSVFEPEVEEEPRQWAHADHLVRAMARFRKLMLVEQQGHRALAKRLAIACEAEWRRRNPQPKTAEEIEFEEIEKSKVRWRQVNRIMAATWENVRTEVNRRRLADWEAEEQRRVKAALNQAVNLSEQKLLAQQTRPDTEELSDDELTNDLMSNVDSDEDLDAESEALANLSDEDGDDEDNMSSSEDEDDKASELSDEGLTQVQLREKYANLPALDPALDDATPADEATTPAPDDDDTSDESVDMDDDMGSSEDESEEGDEEENDASNDDEDESEGEPAGLLGLFFGKSELKKLQDEAPEDDADADDVDMIDASALDETEPVADVTVVEATAHQPAADPSESTAPLEEQAKEQEPSNSIGPLLGGGKRAEGVSTELAGPVSASTRTTPAVVASSATASATFPSGDIAATGKPSENDVTMEDVPGWAESTSGADGLAIPSVQHPSPETEPTTNVHSPSRSQSPRASDDTKPTDVETPASLSLLNAPKTDSRSTSPQLPAPKTEIPFLLRGTLREYQHLGLDWLAALYSNNTNGILADEMGLGKTIQTIALLSHLACHHEVWGPHLVIVPTSVMLNWEMEFKKWCPGFRILTYYGNQEERKRKRQGWTNDDVWNVCITSYQMVLQDQQVFRRRRWHYMILDEAHNIKNFKSQRWQTLLGFNTRSRLLLTGTPLQNNLTELWSLLYFLAPPENGEGGFVDLKEFHNWFSRPESQILESGREQLDDEARAIISKLHKVLRPYLLRRLKADVEKQMPAKYEHVEFCRLSKRQRELYDGFLSRADTRETLNSGNYMSIINCLMQLRKVCNHPDLFVDRPIMTSFRMQRSVATDFEVGEQLIRRKLLAVKPMDTVSLSFLNMIPTRYEDTSSADADRISQLSTHRILLDLREAQKTRANNAYHTLDPASVKSNLVYLESAARWGRFEELQHCVYLNALRRQQRPIYGKRLLDLLTFDTPRRPYKQRPKVPQKVMSWFEEDSYLLHNAIPTLQQRADSMETTISKFACVTPAVVTGDMTRLLLGPKGVQVFEETDLKLSAPVRYAPYMPKERPPDPWHESRMRLSIQFPDKRLLQYDCGKLQALDKLLRRLQAGGHRALIFTQMTKVLDILEQFLNIHGHKYLRLDGATKVEQRQILTDRFNHDPRILCFILSTRSGGLGINLTGADTVIFYDQDWNPAMDKQCQDRCHRIGQTRDVHIYRLVSEHTIEANILRKASQKQMLDDVVIQEGEFTTDYFNKLAIRDVIGTNGEVIGTNEDDVAANAAMDRVLGGVVAGGGGGETGNGASSLGVSAAHNPRGAGRALLEQAEDKEDVAAARQAEKEIQQDDADFLEPQQVASGVASASGTAAQGTPREGTVEPLSAAGVGVLGEDKEDEAAVVEHNAFGGRMHTVDDYMVQFMVKALENTPLELPKDKKRSRKRGKDTRKR